MSQLGDSTRREARGDRRIPPAAIAPPRFPIRLVLSATVPSLFMLLAAGIVRALNSHSRFWLWFGLAGFLGAAIAIAIGLNPAHPRIQLLERRLAPPRLLTSTREGKYFIGITMGVGFAAINTGNNLLYLLVGMMLSLIIASGILSEMSLRRLEVQRRPPARIHAGRPFLMGISLRNLKSKLPSFSVEVEDLVHERPLDKKCYFLKVPAGRRQQTSYRHTVARRGRYVFTGFRISTKFPFALFRKSRTIEDRTEVIVYPAIHPVQVPPPPFRARNGAETRMNKSRRGDFHGLREYRDGDDPRDVHWLASARQGTMMIREYEDEAARRVTLFVDNALPGGAGCTDPELLDGLERAVSLAASLAVHYLERGYSLRLIARDESLPWAQGLPQLARLLRTLALLPVVDEKVPFAASAEPGVEALHVARRGAARGALTARVLEA